MSDDYFECSKDEINNKTAQILNYLKGIGEEHNSGIKSILYYYYYIKLGWCGCGDVSAASYCY